MRKSGHTIVHFPVFSDYTVHVEIAADLEDAVKKYKHTRDIEVGPDVDGLAIHVDYEPISYLFVPPRCSVGTIAHECWHVVHRMLKHVGVDIESETVAYHLGYLVDKVTDFSRGGKK
jgi:hypothetical protein